MLPKCLCRVSVYPLRPAPNRMENFVHLRLCISTKAEVKFPGVRRIPVKRLPRPLADYEAAKVKVAITYGLCYIVDVFQCGNNLIFAHHWVRL